MLYSVEGAKYPAVVTEPDESVDVSRLEVISALIADVRRVLRLRHYSLRTETAYLGWI